MGEIYHIHFDVEMDDGDGTELGFEITAIMMADEGKYETDCNSAMWMFSPCPR